MPLTKSSEQLLHSMALPSLKTAGSTALYTTPVGKTTIITKIVIRNVTASLAGGTSYSVTGFRQAFSLANLTQTTGCMIVEPADLSMLTMIVGGTTINFTVTTGSTAASAGMIDVFGYTF